MNEKHILVVSQYFYPEQFRINDICQEWVKRGYNVTVVTGIPNYPKGKYYKGYGIFKKRKETYNGINIIRIPLIPRGNNNSILLSLNYISFVVSGYFWKLFSNIKADYVFIYETSPMTQAYIGTWYAKKNGVPCYLYVLDLWPESVQVMTGLSNGNAIMKLLDKMVKSIYSGCDKIFTSSQSFINEIEKGGVQRDKLEFWPQYAEDFYKPLNKSEVNISEIPKDDKFNIIFAGNLGYAQGLEILPDVAKLIKDNSKKIRLCIVGDGRFKGKLLELTKQKDVNDIFLFIDRQPAERIPEFMATCDAALIILQKSELFAKTIPAKIQSCMACGIPIVLSADGEAQSVIEQSKCGVYCDANDAVELYNKMIEISNLSKQELDKMMENAIIFNNENYEQEMLLNKMDEYFSSNIGGNKNGNV